MRRILGMFSKVPGDVGVVVSCSERAWRRCLGAEVMMDGVAWEVQWVGASRDAVLEDGEVKYTYIAGRRLERKESGEPRLNAKP